MLKSIGQKKTELLQRLMSAKGIDALLLTEPVSYAHLVFTRVAQSVVVTQKQDPFVLIHPYSRDYVQLSCFSKNLIGVYPYEVRAAPGEPSRTPTDVLRNVLGDSRTAGIDFAHTPYFKVVDLSKSLPNVTMVDCTPLLASVFECKDEPEIGIIRKAVEIAEEGMRTAARTVAAGVPERVVALTAEYRMRQLGASGFEFPSNANSGARGCWMGLPASEKMIDPGDAVGIDLGPVYSGYNADLCRTVSCEAWPRQVEQMFETVESALQVAIGAIKPGVEAEEVDGKVRNFCAERGWEGKFVHHTGHPVGSPWGPWLIQGCRETLKEGMVLALEPGLYEPDMAGVRLEVDVVVRKGGAEVLGGLPIRMM